MNIIKEAAGGAPEEVRDADLAYINAFSRRPLKGEEVYVFSVRLCDNEVDRDGERFEAETLKELAPLFQGKSGIFDHQWSARGQSARIFRTEVVREPETVTRAGDGLCWLKGYAYMLRTPGSEELIARIEGGILREVSVGCAVERAVCSVCGAPRGECRHTPGERYGGKLCYVSLQGGRDAFEWSFVAVPAQREAGVLKGIRAETAGLRRALGDRPEELERLKRLEREAADGRRWREELRREVVRLGLLADGKAPAELLERMTEGLEVRELETMREVYAARVEERFPLPVQLDYGERTADAGSDGAFII